MSGRSIRWPRYLPDLTLWHQWHSSRGSLPSPWEGLDLPSVCRRLGVPCWRTVKPWRMETPGITVRAETEATERTVRWETPAGTLSSRWTLGPDGDWWQAEYPVKAARDFEAARLVAQAREYVAGPDPAQPPAPGSGDSLPGGDIPALELPQRPWSELFHVFLGWAEGLMLFLEEPAAVRQITDVLELKMQTLVAALARMPGAIVLSPDNLDGQFVTPDAFSESLFPSYARDTETLHAAGKLLVVHVGGPVRRLLPLLSSAGVDCVEGVAGAPQGDTSLAEARELCGPGIALWGGIAQDYLMPNRTEREFEAAAAQAFDQARTDGQSIVGVADRVPVEADPERLRALARIAEREAE